MRTVFALAITALIFAFSGWLFAAVLPAPAAWILAGVVAAIELIGAAKNGTGSGLRALIKLNLTLLAWPAAALLMQYAGVVADRPARIALAAAVASAAGIAASRHGSGADSQRLWSVIAAVSIPLYAVLHTIALHTLDPLALSASCLAAGVAVLVARGALVWPDDHRAWMLVGAAVAGAAAALCAVPLVI